MAEYNLSEFRKNTRKAFDEAERGEPVYIDRYGEDFILISKKNWNDTMLEQSKAGSLAIATPLVDDLTKQIAPNKKNNSDSQANKNDGGLPGVGEL